MDITKKTATYTTTNSYQTLNILTPKTKTIWIVLHGIGYLSNYFLRFFDELKPDENYIIAPQAPSKYYLNNKYRRVGSSWLTKEDTQQEINNITNYLDSVIEAEKLPDNCNLNILGYSQGVSIATRWVAKRQLKCTHLILYAGKIPEEHTTSDFQFLIKNNTKVTFLHGDDDAFLNEKVIEVENKKIKVLFSNTTKTIVYEGGHDLKKDLLQQFTR